MNEFQQAVQQLKKSISGGVILPGDADYDKARRTFMAKGEPAIIVQPLSAGEVASAVTFARQHKLVMSVRSGGHSGAGHSTNDDGLVIDVTRLHTIEVIDDRQHIVRVGAGATWGSVAEGLAQHGLAISSGDTKTVGVSGLALGGGIGWMVRKYGLTLDNVVAVELVTADSEVVRASETSHPDLFWAVRGGGGNFGVAVSFDIVANQTSEVYSGMVMYDLHDLAHVLTGWRDYMRTAPDELTTMFLAMPPRTVFADMPSAAIILICYAGDNEAEAMQAINPLLKLGKIINKDIARKPYHTVLEEAHSPEGLNVITNDAFVHELSDELIDTISKCNQILQIRSLGGAINRVAADATAFAHRDSEVLIVAPTFTSSNATSDEIDKALAPWRSIEAFSNGAYINFLTNDSQKELEAAYPPATLARLAQIKKQYDPENIFNHNYNIKPAS